MAGVEFSKKKRKEKGGLDFFPKGEVGKMGVCFKKGGYHLFSNSVVLSSVIFPLVFGVCVFCLFTPLLSIMCVLQEEASLLASNQQIYHFYK